jgi:hypothetical protein
MGGGTLPAIRLPVFRDDAIDRVEDVERIAQLLRDGSDDPIGRFRADRTVTILRWLAARVASA